MFMYRDDTSIEASLQFVGSWVASIWLINSVVSLTYEGRFLTYGCSHLSTNCDIFSVMLSQLETMGQIPIGFLWIFFRKYSFEVLCLTGGLQNSYHGFRRKPFFSSSSNILFIKSFSLCVIFSLSGLYVVWSLRCFIASAMYSLLSWTTIVEPSSALFIISIGLLMNWFRACRSLPNSV